jgi:hypothetical protein
LVFFRLGSGDYSLHQELALVFCDLWRSLLVFLCSVLFSHPRHLLGIKLSVGFIKVIFEPLKLSGGRSVFGIDWTLLVRLKASFVLIFLDCEVLFKATLDDLVVNSGVKLPYRRQPGLDEM